MKQPGLVLLTVALVASGCNRSDTSNSGSTTSATNASALDAGQVQPLSPTSRDTQSRHYGDPTNANASQYDANNTGRNVRDRSDASLTPEDQGGNPADRELTRKIRAALTDNDQLSVDAKNIKVITVNGKVTLRGPVASEEERLTIANILQKAGATSVENQLEVKNSKQ